jgi:hypothetical protein
VPNVDSVSGFSILDLPFGLLWRLLSIEEMLTPNKWLVGH